MVATAIAYFSAALCFAIGIHGFYRIGADKIPVHKESVYLIVSACYIAAAWGCAYLGGI